MTGGLALKHAKYILGLFVNPIFSSENSHCRIEAGLDSTPQLAFFRFLKGFAKGSTASKSNYL